MSTKKLYFCNLCKDEVGGDSRRMARGFRFGSGRINWDSMQQCENHLCDNCFDMLMATFQSPPITVTASQTSG